MLLRLIALFLQLWKAQLANHILHNISGVHEFTATQPDTCSVTIFLSRMPATELTLITRCVHPESAIEVRIIHIQKNSEKFTLTTQQHHDYPHTRSSVIVHGVLYDEAIFTYHGAILVGEQAPFTQAEQKSHTLLLSASARAQATPSLQVLNKQVQAKHGSAIASVQPEQLAYCASRGISPIDAEKLLVESFLRSALDDASMRELSASLAEISSLS